MAANDPGLAQMGALAEDPAKGAIEATKDGDLVEEDRPVAPDQFDEKFETGKYEIWVSNGYMGSPRHDQTTCCALRSFGVFERVETLLTLSCSAGLLQLLHRQQRLDAVQLRANCGAEPSVRAR